MKYASSFCVLHFSTMQIDGLSQLAVPYFPTFARWVSFILIGLSRNLFLFHFVLA